MGIWWDINAKIETCNGDIWGYKGNWYIYTHNDRWNFIQNGAQATFTWSLVLQRCTIQHPFIWSLRDFIWSHSQRSFLTSFTQQIVGVPQPSWKRCKGKSDTIHGFKSLFTSKSPLELRWVQDPQTTHRCSYFLVGYRYGGFLSHRATPSHHPFFFGIFHEIFTIHSSLGVPPTSWGHEGTHPMPSTVHLAFRGRTHGRESWWVPRVVCYLWNNDSGFPI